jgi:hypothetical protein
MVLQTFPEAELIHSDDIGDYAVELAVRGWAVFPLRGKVPAISKGDGGSGVLDATTDVDHVIEWWGERYKGANIGARVPEHAFVLDVDPRHGGDRSLARLIAKHGDLPDTLTVASGREDGGRHFYMRRPDAKLTSRVLGDGLDLKTHAGYCVMPPSRHPDTGRPYRWVSTAPVAAPPPWLVDLITVMPPTMQEAAPRRRFWSRFTTSVADRYAESTTWAHILQPHGWRCLDHDGDADGARWLHPTATSAHSATIKHGCLFVYSPNTPLEETTPGDPHGYTKFRAHAVLDHGGDLSAAARELKAVL